jgi:hypothetical protein
MSDDDIALCLTPQAFHNVNVSGGNVAHRPQHRPLTPDDPCRASDLCALQSATDIFNNLNLSFWECECATACAVHHEHQTTAS